MELSVLGPVQAVDADRPLALGSPKQRLVLSVLICAEGQVVSTDSLIDALWADNPPMSARANVQQHILGLRKALGARHVLSRGRHGYSLNIERGQLDVFRFIDLVGDGRRALAEADWARAGRLLRDALALWRGEPFSDLSDEPALRPWIAQLHELRLDALEHRMDADLASGDHGDTVLELRRLVRRHPYRERFHEQLMLALYQSGQSAAALEVYREARMVLISELGLEPTARLRRLETAILKGEPVPRERNEPIATVPHYLPPDVAAFAGRAEQLRVLRELAAGVGNRVVVISGMAGVGKTALAVHWAHTAAGLFPDGQLYVDLRGYAPEPPLTALAALTLFLRALGVPPSSVPVDIDGAAGQFRSLLDGKAVLLILDNARTAEQVRPLLPGHGACMAVVTSRERLTGLLARDNARRLPLDLLSKTESVALLHDFLPGAPSGRDESSLARLAAACGHLPLALRIAAAKLADGSHRDVSNYVTALAADRRLERLSITGDTQASVQAAFALSYQVLTTDAQRLFRTLSVMPSDDVEEHAIGALLGRGRESVPELLDELADAHLCEQRAGGRFGLHDLLRQFGIDEANRSGDDQGSIVERVCDFHLGTVNSAAALLYAHTIRIPGSAEAGNTSVVFEDATQVRRWLDAELSNLVTLAQHAARFAPKPMAWLLADALRGYFWIRRPVAEWLAMASTGLATATQAGNAHAIAAMHLSLGQAYRSLGRIDSAEEHLLASLAASSAAGWDVARASGLGQLAVSHAQRGNNQRAIELLENALEINRRTGRRSGEAVTLTNRGALNYQLGNLTQACADARAALALYRETGNLTGEAVVLANLGINHVFLGETERARQYLADGQRLGEQTGDRIALVLSQFGYARLHADAGEFQQALLHAESAAETARETGDVALSATCTADLAVIRQRLEHDGPDPVAECLRALDIARDSSDAHSEVWTLMAMARACAHQGRHADQARRHAYEALTLARKHSYRLLEGEALLVLAELLADPRLAAEAEQVLAECGYRAGAGRANDLIRESAPQ